MTYCKAKSIVAGPVERRARRREPEVGMWLRIQARYDRGGPPLIRVEEIDERGWVYVTDWLDFDKPAARAPTPTGYIPPRKRVFAFETDEFSRRSLRYWKKVTPMEGHHG